MAPPPVPVPPIKHKGLLIAGLSAVAVVVVLGIGIVVALVAVDQHNHQVKAAETVVDTFLSTNSEARAKALLDPDISASDIRCTQAQIDGLPTPPDEPDSTTSLDTTKAQYSIDKSTKTSTGAQVEVSTRDTGDLTGITFELSHINGSWKIEQMICNS